MTCYVLWSHLNIGIVLVFLREAIFLGYSVKKKFREKKLENNKNQKKQMEMKSSKMENFQLLLINYLHKVVEMKEKQGDTYGVWFVSLKIGSKLVPMVVENANLVAVQCTQDNVHKLGFEHGE